MSFADRSLQDRQVASVIGRRHRPAVMEEPHAHADIELNYVLSGGLTYLFGAGTHRVAAGRLVVFWASVPHRVVEVLEGTDFIFLTVPLPWLLQPRVPASLTDRLLGGELIVAEASPPDRFFAERWVADLATGDTVRHDTVLLELEARLRRLAPAARVAPLPGTESQLERIARFAAEHYREPISVGAIAAAVKLHPSYAKALFKSGAGIGLWEYVVRLRLAHAQRLLLTTDLPCDRVGLESGFGSASSFYATFGRASGQTPRRYRRACTGG